jgi:LmbE family N-acetylglucosaminyl deacetylase
MSNPPAPDLSTVLGIWAHPDDEAYLAGGLMARAADAGYRAACVTATRGEHGTPDPLAWPPARLAALREHELRASLAVLGVGDHEFLDLPDGTCASQDERTQVDRLAEIVRRVRPTTIVTFRPVGYTGHEDHRTISRWATAAHRRSAPEARLLHATCSAERARRWDDVHRQLHVFLAPGLPRRTPASCLCAERLDCLVRPRIGLLASRRSRFVLLAATPPYAPTCATSHMPNPTLNCRTPGDVRSCYRAA